MRGLQSVLNNFLGHFTSRYSEYDGYWIFGFIINDLEQEKISLLSKAEGSAVGMMEKVTSLARDNFLDQLTKAGVKAEVLDSAELSLTRASESQPCRVNGIQKGCFDLTLAVDVSAQGRTYRAHKVIRVAPHDKDVELKSLK